jgi:hypothetical protein
VVDGVVAHLSLDIRGANKVWKFKEEGADRSTDTDDFDAGDLRTGGLGNGRQRRDSNKQAVVPAVHREVEMGEETSPDEGLSDVGNHEPSCEIPA